LPSIQTVITPWLSSFFADNLQFRNINITESDLNLRFISLVWTWTSLLVSSLFNIERVLKMSRYKFFAFLAVPVLVLASFAFAEPSAAATPVTSADRAAVLETKMALRDLWVEHIFWIRSYVVAEHAGDKAQSKIAENEVVANAKALANTIAPFYGQPAADALLKLLAGHWGAVRDFNTATIAKSRSDQDKAVANLTSNAHEIAKFLSGANPYLPEDGVFGLLAAHGAQHATQIKQVASGDFQGEAATWHAMRKHVMVIADAIADALGKQFPERFQNRS
jgi:hypothetical protein